MTNALLDKHPELESTLRLYDIKTYRSLSSSGKIREYYEKDDNGVWKNVTRRERLKQEIANAQEELERRKRDELLRRIKQTKDE